MRCVPQTTISEHDEKSFCPGGCTLDDLIEYVKKQMAGASDEDDNDDIDESDPDDSDDEASRGRSLRFPRTEGCQKVLLYQLAIL